MAAIRKTTFALMFVTMLGIGSKLEAAQVSIGITIGRPPEPRVVRVVPRRPAPEYIWVEGYWYPDHKKYRWHEGYWTRPPYENARWVAPRYERDVYIVGYWETDRGRFDHDHQSDRDRDRDSGKHGRGNGNGRGNGKH